MTSHGNQTEDGHFGVKPPHPTARVQGKKTYARNLPETQQKYVSLQRVFLKPDYQTWISRCPARPQSTLWQLPDACSLCIALLLGPLPQVCLPESTSERGNGVCGCSPLSHARRHGCT